MFKCKVLNIPTLKLIADSINEVPTYLRSIRKIMEKKRYVEMGILGVDGALSITIFINKCEPRTLLIKRKDGLVAEAPSLTIKINETEKK